MTGVCVCIAPESGVYALKIKYNSTINTCNVQQCVTRLNQTVSLMYVGGGGGQLLVCVNCAFNSLGKRDNTSTLLVLATKSSSSLSEVIERVGFNEHTPHQVTAHSDSGKL